MMDLLQKRSEVEGKDDQRKSCTDCHITRTPLWRRGPCGPKTLCNACGIKYNKNRRQPLGLERRGKQRVNKKQQQKKKSDNEMGKSLKMRLVALGRKMGLKISADLREEEEAAILLMALSCGSLSSMLD